MLAKHFNPNKSFLSLKIFWITILSMSSSAGLAFIIIYIHTPMHLDLSANGFSGFIDIFKFPLSILTLIIPIVILLASNHRSEQTRKQIEISMLQNTFQNYYKHIEEFTRYTEQISDITTKSRIIHKIIFPDAFNGSYDSSLQLILDYSAFINESLKLILNANSNNTDTKSICDGIRKNCMTHLDKIGFSRKSLLSVESKETNFFIGEAINGGLHDSHTSIYSILILLIKPLSTINEYYLFSLNYETPSNISSILKFDFDKHKNRSSTRQTDLIADISKIITHRQK